MFGLFKRIFPCHFSLYCVFSKLKLFNDGMGAEDLWSEKRLIDQPSHHNCLSHTILSNCREHFGHFETFSCIFYLNKCFMYVLCSGPLIGLFMSVRNENRAAPTLGFFPVASYKVNHSQSVRQLGRRTLDGCKKFTLFTKSMATVCLSGGGTPHPVAEQQLAMVLFRMDLLAARSAALTLGKNAGTSKLVSWAGVKSKLDLG